MLNPSVPLVDSWGHEFVYVICDDPRGQQYVIVAMGRDGRLDVASARDYLDAPHADVNGQYDRDLVVVDGDVRQSAQK